MSKMDEVPFPPSHLVFMDKTIENGLKHGRTMLERIESYGARTDDGAFFDVGCGWGRLTYALLNKGFKGAYSGIDVLALHIKWLRENVSPIRPNFQFHHIDVPNARYNPNGKQERLDVCQYVKAVDTCVALSVFTHMYEDDIAHYLNEVRNVIASDGFFVFTGFIMSPAAKRSLGEGNGRFSMLHELNDHCRFESVDDPLFAIAYDKVFFEKLLSDAYLAPTYYWGTWAGVGEDQLQFQDWVVARPY